MKSSEYRAALKALEAEHGDLEVEKDNYWGRSCAPPPKIDYRKILDKREKKDRFWYDFESIEKRGEKCIRV